MHYTALTETLRLGVRLQGMAHVPRFHTGRSTTYGGCPARDSLFVFLWAALRPRPCTKTPFCQFACFGEKQYRTTPKMAQPHTIFFSLPRHAAHTPTRGARGYFLTQVPAIFQLPFLHVATNRPHPIRYSSPLPGAFGNFQCMLWLCNRAR